MTPLYPRTRASMTQEASWNLRQSMFGPHAEMSAIADTIPASAAPSVSEILRGYTFSPYEFRTLYADGIMVQAAMLVSNPSDPSDRFIIICNIETGTESWSVQCPKFRQGEGPAFIEAAQRRLEANRLGKAVN